GALFTLTLRSSRAPAANANVQVMFSNPSTGSSNIAVVTPDARGRVSVPYDPRYWVPAAVIVTPHDSQWSWWQNSPASGSVVTLADLPPAGSRLGWWHQLLGIAGYSETRGNGLRVGIADTGVGPHPYLAHVQSAGAFLNGGHDASPDALADVDVHGTHLAGII